MTDINVKSKWVLQSIEYAGLGDTPYFILKNSQGEVKLVAVTRGVTDLRGFLEEEE